MNARRLLLSLLALCLAAGSARATTLKIATVAPEGTSWMREMRRGAAEIAERTEGRVKLKFYPGGVMGNEQTVLRKMRIGQLHGGAFTTGTLATLYRDAELYSLPFLFRSYDEVDSVRARFDAGVRAGLEAAGMVVLAISETGFAYFMSSQPLRSVDDLRRTRVWAQETDVMSRTALEITGVSPVSLPLSDVYTGLQTGLVDTVAAPPMAAIGLQWHTRVKYVTDVPLVYLTGVLALDPKAFGRLTAADRAVVREVVSSAAATLDAETRSGNREAREALVAQGVQFVEAPSEVERGRWLQIADETVARLREKEIYSEAMIEALRSHLRDYRDSAGASVDP